MRQENCIGLYTYLSYKYTKVYTCW